jgi:EAL domain-containing protein (putative c-di-GMP-specific phosphodiesterase class I)
VDAPTCERSCRGAAYGSLYLHYQPIYESASGRPIALEALARWNAPDRGGISPTEFVHAAEQHGLIGPLTQWVLSSACREASRWTQQLQVSVNLSPLNLRDAALVPTVERVLKETWLSPSRLVLELTEGSLIDWSEDVALRLGALREDRCRVVAGRFRLRLRQLRISPAPRLRRREDRQELPGAIGKATGAPGRHHEGVETTEHRELLAELGCVCCRASCWHNPSRPSN